MNEEVVHGIPGRRTLKEGDIVTLPVGLIAKYTPGTDQKVDVVAVRFKRTEDENSEFLVVKSDKSTMWAGRDQLDFATPEH